MAMVRIEPETMNYDMCHLGDTVVITQV